MGLLPTFTQGETGDGHLQNSFLGLVVAAYPQGSSPRCLWELPGNDRVWGKRCERDPGAGIVDVEEAAPGPRVLGSEPMGEGSRVEP